MEHRRRGEEGQLASPAVQSLRPERSKKKTHVMTMQSMTCPNWEKASRSESLLVPLYHNKDDGQLCASVDRK